METHKYKRSTIVWAILKSFPPLFQQSLISDPEFSANYDLKSDVQIILGEDEAVFLRSEFYSGIREILADKHVQLSVKDMDDTEWQLSLSMEGDEDQIILSNQDRHLPLSDLFFALSSESTERIRNLEQMICDKYLPEQAVDEWRAILSTRELQDDELDLLNNDFKDTPIHVAANIRSEMKRGTSQLSTLVPSSESYFNCLVGSYNPSLNIMEYIDTSANEHIRQLMAWKSHDGFLFSLLLSSHSSVSSANIADEIDAKELSQIYEWLQGNGDSISQIGAIEIGLSILDKRPEIEPYIQRMIEQIRDDNTDNDQSRFKLLSSLIMLVEGELSRTKTLRGKPPFWRRLASIAQASLIERCLIEMNVEITQFIEWAMQVGGEFFYFQTLTDLRQEPRWDPDYISAEQLKNEFISRIVGAAQKYTSKISTPALRKLLFDNNTTSLNSLIVFPSSYLPGPLEGGFESQSEIPEEISEMIEEHLGGDVLQLKSFTVLVNSVLLFRVKQDQVQLAVKALRAVKYQLKQPESKEQLFGILKGLATVAAVTRNSELARELKILTRQYRNKQEYNISTHEALLIGLVAAASYTELIDWCEFVGEWITELAFQQLDSSDIERLDSHITQLCHIVPELWSTCGRADAALKSLVKTHLT